MIQAGHLAWAWAAGLFEGEGTITHNNIRKDGSYAWKLQISLTDLDVLKTFQWAVGGIGNITARKPAEGRKQIWEWKTSKQSDVFAILYEIWPYLGERRGARAKEAIGDILKWSKSE